MVKSILCCGICFLAVGAFYVGLHIFRKRAKRREESYVTIPNFLRGGSEPIDNSLDRLTPEDVSRLTSTHFRPGFTRKYDRPHD